MYLYCYIETHSAKSYEAFTLTIYRYSAFVINNRNVSFWNLKSRNNRIKNNFLFSTLPLLWEHEFMGKLIEKKKRHGKKYTHTSHPTSAMVTEGRCTGANIIIFPYKNKKKKTNQEDGIERREEQQR